MKKGLLVCLILSLSCSLSVADESRGKTKMIVGGVLMGSGLALSAHAWNRCDFGPGNCGEAEFYSGVAMFWTGTGLLIWGISNHLHSRPSHMIESDLKPTNVILGIAPLRKGAAGALCIRW